MWRHFLPRSFWKVKTYFLFWPQKMSQVFIVQRDTYTHSRQLPGSVFSKYKLHVVFRILTKSMWLECTQYTEYNKIGIDWNFWYNIFYLTLDKMYFALWNYDQNCYKAKLKHFLKFFSYVINCGKQVHMVWMSISEGQWITIICWLCY